jgi:threonine synthase
MDVGNPSNFVRILEIFDKQLHLPQIHLSSVSISDEETVAAILDLYTHHHYLPDPHGAVGYLALQRYLAAHPGAKGIFLETAHPVKFYDVVEPLIGSTIPLPENVKTLLNRQKHSTRIAPDYAQLKDFCYLDVIAKRSDRRKNVVIAAHSSPQNFRYVEKLPETGLA